MLSSSSSSSTGPPPRRAATVRRIVPVFVLGVAAGVLLHAQLSFHGWAYTTESTAAVAAIAAGGGHTEEGQQLRVSDVIAEGCRAKLQACRERRRSESPTEASAEAGASAASTKPSGKLNLKMKLGDCRRLGKYSLMVPCFPNNAIEREMTRHDRWIVDSLSFVQSLDGGEGGGDTAMVNISKTTETRSQKAKPITMIILTVNRQVPYLAVLITSLLRGHDLTYLVDNVHLHIINIERRPCKCAYSLFSELRPRLPFASFHDWTEPYVHRANYTNYAIYGGGARGSFYADQKSDYLRALGICKEEGSDWCLILEDDVAAAADMVPKFMQLTKAEGGLDRSELGFISLYYPLNERLNWNGKYLYSKNPYARGSDEWLRDISASDYMVGTEGKSRGRIKYRLETNDRGYGAVANAFPSERIGQIIDFVGRGRGSPDEHPVDITLMSLFTNATNTAKLRVSPSLANHVGFYSEHRMNEAKDDRSDNVHRLMSTDVRFRLEDA